MRMQSFHHRSLRAGLEPPFRTSNKRAAGPLSALDPRGLEAPVGATPKRGLKRRATVLRQRLPITDGLLIYHVVPVAVGEIDPAFAGAARVVEAEYEWPFQSHASMGPACAVVDAREDGATL